MIRAFTELRVLATFRRIAKAMEEANRLERHRQEVEHPPIKTTDPPPRKTLVMSKPSVDDWNGKNAS